MRGNSSEYLRVVRDQKLGYADKLLTRRPTSAKPGEIENYRKVQAQKASPYIKEGLEAGFQVIAEDLEKKPGCGLRAFAIITIGSLIASGGVYAVQHLIK